MLTVFFVFKVLIEFWALTHGIISLFCELINVHLLKFRLSVVQVFENFIKFVLDSFRNIFAFKFFLSFDSFS